MLLICWQIYAVLVVALSISKFESIPDWLAFMVSLFVRYIGLALCKVCLFSKGAEGWVQWLVATKLTKAVLEEKGYYDMWEFILLTMFIAFYPR